MWASAISCGAADFSHWPGFLQSTCSAQEGATMMLMADVPVVRRVWQVEATAAASASKAPVDAQEICTCSCNF